MAKVTVPEESIDELVKGVALRRQNAEWFERNCQRLFRNGYADNWVAVCGGKVVCSNHRLGEVLYSLAEKGYDSVVDGVYINYLQEELMLKLSMLASLAKQDKI